LLGVSGHMVPTTFLRYPLLVEDGSYLFEKLRPILPETSFDEFQTAFEKTVRPELVHDFGTLRIV